MAIRKQAVEMDQPPPHRLLAALGICLVAALVTLVLYASGAQAANLSRSDMESDLDFITGIISQTHPAFVTPQRSNELRELSSSLKAQLPQSSTTEDFFFIANKLVSSVHDAHTSLYASSETLSLPLVFKWVSDGLVVTSSLCSIPVGSEVVTIGNQTPDALLPWFTQNIPAENPNWVKVRAASLLVQHSVLKELNLAGESVIITCREPSGVLSTEQLSFGSPVSVSNRPWFGRSFDSVSSTAIFYLDRCDDTDEYRTAVDNFFIEVAAKGIKKVAIDVRRNTGGNSRVIESLLRYLPVSKVRGFSGDIRYSPEAQKQRGYKRSAGMSRINLIKRLFGYGRMRVTQHAPANLTFKGKLYVFTSWQTFSSGNWIAGILYENNLATLVGEQTGNAPSSFGDALSFKLPHSKLHMTVSHKRWVRPNSSLPQSDCYTPQVLIPTTIHSIASGTDEVVEWVKAQN